MYYILCAIGSKDKDFIPLYFRNIYLPFPIKFPIKISNQRENILLKTDIFKASEIFEYVTKIRLRCWETGLNMKLDIILSK